MLVRKLSDKRDLIIVKTSSGPHIRPLRIMLVGIVVSLGVLLVEFTNHLLAEAA